MPKIVQIHDNGYFLDGFDPKQLYLHEIIEALVSKKSEFQQIDIFRTAKYGKALTLDGFPQIAEIGDSYTEALVIPALFFHHNPGRVLILGGGDGPALALVLKDPRVKEVVRSLNIPIFEKQGKNPGIQQFKRNRAYQMAQKRV